MKINGLFRTLALTLTCVLWLTQTDAQNMFLIHEDVVNPEMLMEYEGLAKELNGYIKEHGSKEMAYNTAMTNDLRYSYIVPIENLGEIDKMGSRWEALSEKVGEEKMKTLWNNLDKCYDVHRNYIVYLSEELSYYPPGEIMNSNGTYRKWTKISAHPDKIQDLTAMARKWKELYQKHNIDHGYRVYFGGLGTDLGTMIIVDYGKDLSELANNEKMFQEKCGQEGGDLWKETTFAIRKIEEKYGQMRPDLSYNPD